MRETARSAVTAGIAAAVLFWVPLFSTVIGTMAVFAGIEAMWKGSVPSSRRFGLVGLTVGGLAVLANTIATTVLLAGSRF